MLINPVQFNHTPDIFVVNQKQYNAHIELYEGYVTSINKITKQVENADEEVLQTANATNGYWRGLKRGESYAMNGVILHELYFRNIGGCTTDPDECIVHFIEEYYGTFSRWAEEFVATAKASRGWTMLVYEQRTKSLRNISLDTHDDGMLALCLPLLVIDMYEHAYFMQYGTAKAKYIDAFMVNIHWNIVKQRIRLWRLIDEI